jgi:RecA/RadA recombinase
MSLLEKLKKNSTIEDTDILSKSEIFNVKDQIPTAVPMINVALSGDLDGGLSSGLTLWCGPSKHFKSAFSLLMAKAYMDKYPESILLFYDSEFGTPRAYFESFEIDMTRVLHTPITDIEKLKFDIMKQLDGITRKDKVIIVIDSVGNLASKKEVDDAMNQNQAADMTRAKQLKSLFRMITPHLTLKDIPMIVVNHIYMTQEMYSKPVVSGGTGIYLSSDNIFIIGRQQEKEGKDVVGYHFIINVEKSRHTKEKSKIPVSVMHDGGISKWSGLLEVALEGKFVVKPNIGWYQKIDPETGEILEQKYREKATNTREFWEPLLASENFKKYIRNKFQVSHGAIMESEVDELENIGDDD